MPEELPSQEPVTGESPPAEPPAAGGAPANREADGLPHESAASVVATGIFSSRLMGFMRVAAESYFFGVGAHADVFQAAFKGPNLLQNLLGEGTLSAAFIPIYSTMLEEGREREAGRFAGAIFGLLLAVAAAFALLGMLLAPYIVAILTPGFVADAGGDVPALVAWTGDAFQNATTFLSQYVDWIQPAAQQVTAPAEVNRYALTVRAVRIVFPMAAILVLSAWALGVLNSHRRFFLPYFAPVLWNTAIIAGLFVTAFAVVGSPFGVDAFADAAQTRLLFGAFVGALFGGALQFAVQLPLVAKVMTGFEFSFSTKVTGVREAIRAFGPVVAGRGVYQISTYLDLFLASWLAAGALSSLRYAQILYILPVSLFGLSVAASELPELSRISREQMRHFLRRLDKSMSQMLFLTIPTFVGYLGFGLLIIGALLRRGSFGMNDNWLVYVVLCGYSLGLMATTASRLLQNAFYALNDTATPARIAVVRVLVSAVVAIPLMLVLDRYNVAATLGFAAEGSPLFFGAVGLALGATAGAWVELWRLLAALRHGGPSFRLPWKRAFMMAGLAASAMVPGVLLWWTLPAWSVLALAPLVVGAYGICYLALAWAFGLGEVYAWTGRFFR